MEEYRRWENNIKMDHKEIGVSVRSWIDSSHDKYYWKALVNLQVTLSIESVNIEHTVCGSLSQVTNLTMNCWWMHAYTSRRSDLHPHLLIRAAGHFSPQSAVKLVQQLHYYLRGRNNTARWCFPRSAYILTHAAREAIVFKLQISAIETNAGVTINYIKTVISLEL